LRKEVPYVLQYHGRKRRTSKNRNAPSLSFVKEGVSVRSGDGISLGIGGVRDVQMAGACAVNAHQRPFADPFQRHRMSLVGIFRLHFGNLRKSSCVPHFRDTRFISVVFPLLWKVFFFNIHASGAIRMLYWNRRCV